MRVAFSTAGEDLSASLDPRFGRADRFLIVDTENGSLSVVDNRQSLTAAQGAGVQSAQHVADASVDAVITGHCGPKAYRALQAAEIRVFYADNGTVGEALDRFLAGELTVATDADVDSHWV
jgi:predicted Fe-Mo cluster-binding NifX family protein